MFTYPYFYTPHPLVRLAARSLRRLMGERRDGPGTMLGVLVVLAADGSVGYLAAQSGACGGDLFVPLIYDIGSNNRIVKAIADNAAQGRSIDALAMDELSKAVEVARERKAVEMAKFKELLTRHKADRDRRRSEGCDETVLIAESQHEKGELRRLKKRLNDDVAEAEQRLAEAEEKRAAGQKAVQQTSHELHRQLYSQFVVHNARGEQASLYEIFDSARGELPPFGAGTCAAPKLLEYAYLHGYRPLAMGEFWDGAPPAGELRRDGSFYGSCMGRYQPILDFMLQGLDVEPNPLAATTGIESQLRTVYEDDHIWVVDKPAGMLSTPGKTGTVSVTDVARQRVPGATGPMVVHRLDMHTSGLLIVAKDYDSFVALRRQFERSQVEKTYIALLDGNVEADEGEINLPLCEDYVNRPRQMVSFSNGREAVTRYRVVDRHDGITRVEFHPLTGRTHQLRVHSAYPQPQGLGAPIHGDTLYGDADVRLCLHASCVAFNHPVTGQRMEFRSQPEF